MNAIKLKDVMYILYLGFLSIVILKRNSMLLHDELLEENMPWRCTRGTNSKRSQH
jgi:hypothetical protein